MINTRILNRIYILLALGALFGALLLRSGVPTSQVIAGTTRIPVTIADTLLLQQQGLSGTKSLPRGTGKLFIFEQADRRGFWMKDMQYPLDIVWIDAEFRVVGITAGVYPESYPEVFYPPVPILYVLELNAYEAVGDNVVVGAKLRFEK